MRVLAAHDLPGGAAEPLGARPLVSRPPDEPPVEEWGREGMTEGAAAPSTPVESTAPLDDLSATESPSLDAPAYDAPSYDAPASDDVD